MDARERAEPDGGGQAFEVPHDLRTEQLLLGTTMRSKDFIADVVKTILPADYYRPVHELIHGAILALYAAGEPTDPITTVAELTKRGQLARYSPVNGVRSIATAGLMLDHVRETALRRRLIETAL